MYLFYINICLTISACKFYGFIGGLFGLMSINTLTAISFDRYLNIANPLLAAKNMTRRKAFKMIVVVWAWSLLWSVPPIFGWGAYVPEGFQTSCTFDYLSTEHHTRSYIFGLYIGGFVVPLVIIVVCYVLIVKAIRKHVKEMDKVVHSLNVDLQHKQEKASTEIKVAKIAMKIITLYILSWSPYATVALIGQFGPAEWVSPVVSEIPVMFAKACAMHNPIVYAFSHPKFREALAIRVPWLLCCRDVKPKTIPSKISLDPSTCGKRPLFRNIISSSNGSEASSCVSNLSEISSKRNGWQMSRCNSSDSDMRSNQVIIELARALTTVANRNTTQSTSKQEHSQDGLFIGDRKQEDLIAYLVSFVNSKENTRETSDKTKGEL